MVRMLGSLGTVLSAAYHTTPGSCFCGCFGYMESEGEKLGGREKPNERVWKRKGGFQKSQSQWSPYLKWVTESILRSEELYES